MNILKTSILAISFLATTTILAVERAPAQNGPETIRKILTRMDDHNKALVTLKASIKMVKFNSQLSETDVREGSLTYARGRLKKDSKFRIDWRTPVADSFSVHDGKYQLYTPRQNQMMEGRADAATQHSKAGSVLALISMSKAQLAANYSVQYMGDETLSSGSSTFHLLLTPQGSAAYKLVHMWVDANGMPVQVKVVEKNNDTTTILLSALDKNPTVNLRVFDIEPKKGTKIIRG